MITNKSNSIKFGVLCVTGMVMTNSNDNQLSCRKMKYITWYLSKMFHVTMLFSPFTLYDKISAKDFAYVCTVYDKKKCNAYGYGFFQLNSTRT